MKFPFMTKYRGKLYPANTEIPEVSEPYKPVSYDVIRAPNDAAVGQTIKVKTVDDNGKPVVWEAADMPNPITDDHINELINAALGVIENGTY